MSKGHVNSGVPGDHAAFLARLRAAVSYDPASGMFTALVRRNGRGRTQPGEAIGKADAYGYVRFSFEGKDHKAHRIAWLMMTGEWPTTGIDHIDTDRSNNRWANLRAADQVQNSANASRSKRNTTGFKGVSWDKSRGRYVAHICHQRRQKWLGHFDDPAEAHAAYVAAAKRLFGEFARAA